MLANILVFVWEGTILGCSPKKYFLYNYSLKVYTQTSKKLFDVCKYPGFDKTNKKAKKKIK